MAETVLGTTIREGHYIVIEHRACKVSDVHEDSSDRNRKRKVAKFRIVARDIFDQTERQLAIKSGDMCIVPQVNRRDYRIERVVGTTAHLQQHANVEVTDNDMLTEIENGLEEKKRMFLTFKSAMGVEQICGVKHVIYPQ